MLVTCSHTVQYIHTPYTIHNKNTYKQDREVDIQIETSIEHIYTYKKYLIYIHQLIKLQKYTQTNKQTNKTFIIINIQIHIYKYQYLTYKHTYIHTLLKKSLISYEKLFK